MGNLIGITLNLQNALITMATLNNYINSSILNNYINSKSMRYLFSLYFLKSSSTSFINVLQF